MWVNPKAAAFAGVGRSPGEKAQLQTDQPQGACLMTLTLKSAPDTLLFAHTQVKLGIRTSYLGMALIGGWKP